MNNMFTCNYYPAGNWGGEYPYTAGSTCSGCSNGCSSNTYTPQSGTPAPTTWDLSGLCIDGSTDDNSGGNSTPSPVTPVATPTPVSSGDDSGDCMDISGITTTSLNGQYSSADSGAGIKWQSDDYYLERKTYGSNSYWGFYLHSGSSPDWSSYPYCYGEDLTNCIWSSNAGAPTISSATCSDDESSSGGSTVVTPSPVTSISNDPCVSIDNWSTTPWGGGFDAGQWDYYDDYEGYNAYKWSNGEYYMYVMSYYKWYTISPSLGAMSGLKGWCGSSAGTHIDVLDCDGVWSSGSNVIFSDCNNGTFVFTPCLDDAADFVHFSKDDGTMSFELHSEMGCFNNEPVWEHATSDETMWYIHFESANGVWQVTMDYVGGSPVYECDSNELADCVEGSWMELYTPDTEGCTAVNATNTPCVATAVRELETARVDLAFENTADDTGGVSTVVVVVIVILVLTVCAVVGYVCWKRSRRMKGEFEFKDEPAGITMKDTGDVQGATIDMGTDDEN